MEKSLKDQLLQIIRTADNRHRSDSCPISVIEDILSRSIVSDDDLFEKTVYSYDGPGGKCRWAYSECCGDSIMLDFWTD